MVIKTISSLFVLFVFFLTKRFRTHKNMSQIKVYVRVENCCFCCLVLTCFCFVSWFLLVTCFCARKIFSSKKNKQAWNCLDNHNLLYYCNWPCLSDIFSFARFLWIFSLLSVQAHLLKALLQETSFFSTAHWMPSHSNFLIVLVEEPRRRASWSDMKMCLKYLNHFSSTTTPISSCIQHIR